MNIRPLLALCAAIILTGCATAKLGVILYCPFGEACSLQKFPAPQPEKEKPLAPAEQRGAVRLSAGSISPPGNWTRALRPFWTGAATPSGVRSTGARF